jgi:hypothetical protein
LFVSTKQGARPSSKKRQPQAQAQKQVKAPSGANAGARPAAATNSNARASAQAQVAQEAKREARLQRQLQAQAAAAQRRRTRNIRRIGITSAILLVVVAGIAKLMIDEANRPGQKVPMMVSNHIADVNSPHAPYTTDPPTSGPHVSTVPAWGVHTEPVAKELAVHSLEDAGVVINYQPDLDKAVVTRLEALTKSYDKDVLMAPYPNLSNPIVLTAWQRIDRLEAFDEARIKRFIDAYKGIDHHKDSGS